MMNKGLVTIITHIAINFLEPQLIAIDFLKVYYYYIIGICFIKFEKSLQLRFFHKSDIVQAKSYKRYFYFIKRTVFFRDSVIQLYIRSKVLGLWKLAFVSYVSRIHTEKAVYWFLFRYITDVCIYVSVKWFYCAS